MFISKVFSLFLVCILAGCGNSVSQPAKTNQTKEKTELSLKLERSGCFDFCPVYQLTIQPDGKILFEGIQDTATKGSIESVLSKEKIIEIIAEIEKADFFSLKDSYTSASDNCPSWAIDAPTAVLQINLNGNEKKITHSLGCHEIYNPNEVQKTFPEKLYNLENKIDEIVETKRWIGERK
jgi:hypothetical protein